MLRLWNFNQNMVRYKKKSLFCSKIHELTDFYITNASQLVVPRSTKSISTTKLYLANRKWVSPIGKRASQIGKPGKLNQKSGKPNRKISLNCPFNFTNLIFFSISVNPIEGLLFSLFCTQYRLHCFLSVIFLLWYLTIFLLSPFTHIDRNF